MPRAISVVVLVILVLFLSSRIAEAVGRNTVSALPVGVNPMGVAFNPKTNRLYVTIAGAALNGYIAVVDTTKNTVVANVSIPKVLPAVINKLVSVDVNPNTNIVYASDAAQQAVFVINGSTNAIISAIRFAGQPATVAVNPKSNLVYVAVQSSNFVAVIDGSMNKVVQTVTVGSNPYAVAVNQITDRVYVTDSAGVSVFDGSTNEVLMKIPLRTGYAIALNPNTNIVYVPDKLDNNGTVFVLNGSNNSLMSKIQACCNLWGITSDSTTDVIYVSNDFENTILVINGSSNRVVGHISVGSMPAYIGLDEQHGHLYVADWGTDTLSVVGLGMNTPEKSSGGQIDNYLILGIILGVLAVFSVTVVTFKRRRVADRGHI